MGNFVTTTNPSTPVQDTGFTLTITDDFTEDGGMFQDTYEPYTLTLAGTYVYTTGNYTIAVDGNSITFGTTTEINIPLSGEITMVVNDDSAIQLGTPTNNIWIDTIDLDPICYVEGSEILCLIDGKEKYVKVEDLTEGTLIKIYLPEKENTYKKMVGITKSTMHPSKSHKVSKIFVLRKDKLGEELPYKDLYVSGAHSYLVDELKEGKELDTMIKFCGRTGLMLYDKYKLMVSISDEWEELDDRNPFTLYHFALEHENEYAHYGVYANGILSESMNIFNLNKALKAQNKNLTL